MGANIIPRGPTGGAQIWIVPNLNDFVELNISLSRGKVSVAVLVALQGAETPTCLKLVQGNAEVMEALLSA